MSWLLLLGGVKRAATGLLPFIQANWRVVLPVVMVALAYWYMSSLQSQRDEALYALERYKLESSIAQQKRGVENAEKERLVTAALEKLRDRHADEINQIKEQYDATRNNDKATADRTIAQWRERVRLEVARYADGLPNDASPTEGTAGSGGDCNAAPIRQAYETLEHACAITTADYNSLWRKWDTACQVYGCE